MLFNSKISDTSLTFNLNIITFCSRQLTIILCFLFCFLYVLFFYIFYLVLCFVFWRFYFVFCFCFLYILFCLVFFCKFCFVLFLFLYILFCFVCCFCFLSILFCFCFFILFCLLLFFCWNRHSDYAKVMSPLTLDAGWQIKNFDFSFVLTRLEPVEFNQKSLWYETHLLISFRYYKKQPQKKDSSTSSMSTWSSVRCLWRTTLGGDLRTRKVLHQAMGPSCLSTNFEKAGPSNSGSLFGRDISPGTTWRGRTCGSSNWKSERSAV